MYEEGHSGFSFKSMVLKLIIIAAALFLIIWLFPTKNYVKNIIDQKLGTHNDQTFTNNINNMKEAAISYFNGDRLPSKEDASEKLTLEEMIDKKLLTDITDSNGKKCDYKKSYTKVTKNKSDYTLKVNLACKDKEDHIISYMVYASDVYSKKKLTDKTENIQTNEETPKSEETANQANSNNGECQYVKQTGAYTSYGAWSNWTTNPVSKTSTREVQTKQEQVQTGTITEQQGTTKHTQNPKKVTLNKDGREYTVYVCPSDFDNGGSYNNFVTCVKTMPNYVTKPTYKNVTYYRYRDNKYINGNKTYKWSTCNDSNLMNQGYKLTGQTK